MRALVTIRTEKAVIRRTKHPALRRRDIPGWVSCNIADIFPAGADNYVYSYRETDDGEKALHLVFLPTDISDGYARLLSGLGLVPSLIDIYQNSLSLGMLKHSKSGLMSAPKFSSIALADVSGGKLALIMRGSGLDGIYNVEGGTTSREYSLLRAHIPASVRFERGYLLSGRPWALDIFNELTKSGVLSEVVGGDIAANLALTGLLSGGGIL